MQLDTSGLLTGIYAVSLLGVHPSNLSHLVQGLLKVTEDIEGGFQGWEGVFHKSTMECYLLTFKVALGQMRLDWCTL